MNRKRCLVFRPLDIISIIIKNKRGISVNGGYTIKSPINDIAMIEYDFLDWNESLKTQT
jgi:hypothetical protein